MSKKGKEFDRSKYSLWIDPNTVTPYEKNAKIHTDKQIKNIVNSIKRFGWQQDVVITSDNVLVIGHGRRLAAIKLGCEMPYHVIDKTADKLTEEDIRELRIADNQTNAETGFDFDALADDIDGLDFDGFDFDFGIDTEEQDEEPIEIVEDEPPTETETRCKVGDLWQLGEHRLVCGDSTDVAVIDRLMDGVKADMAFTDPPYGVEYTGGLQFKDGYVEKNNREMIKNDDTDIYGNVFYMLSRYVNGACYVWFADRKAKTLYENADRYGDIHALIIWVKNGGYGALNANYKQKHEPCLYWNPKGTTLRFIGATTETTVWDINKDGVNEYHPTQKPVALAAKAIQNHDARTVLDLFGGSGSTLIACEQLNRKCYMCELDPKYVSVIIQRYINFKGSDEDVFLLKDGKKIPYSEVE